MLSGIKIALAVIFTMNLALNYFVKETSLQNFLRESAVEVPEFEDAPRVPLEDSEPWNEYLEKLELNKKDLNLLDDEDYCKKVQEYRQNNPIQFDSRGLPTKEYRTVFSEFPRSDFVGNVLSNYTTLVNKRHILGANKEKIPYEPISPAATIFFHIRPTWHYKHQMGVHFLCEGQRYNHIHGNLWLSFKDITANKIRDYSQYYEGREDCFDPWKVVPYTLDITDYEQCQHFKTLLLDDQYEYDVKWMLKKGRYAHNGVGVVPVDQEKAKEIILSDRGTHFDPDVVDAFIAAESRILQNVATFND